MKDVTCKYIQLPRQAFNMSVQTVCAYLLLDINKIPTIKSSRNVNAFTFRFMMYETNETKLFKLCRFLKIVLDKVRSPPG